MRVADLRAGQGADVLVTVGLGSCVAILLHDGRSWFIKLRAPAELVAKQQSAFEAFVRSVRFGAGGK